MVSVVVLMFVAGIATIGITHQAVWLLTSQEPLFTSGGLARRAQSVNNLKQIGLGLGNYAEANETFPPGGTFDAQGQPLHSWMTRVLPFIEQSELHNSIDLEVAWDAPRNPCAPLQERVNTYLNPEISVQTLGGGDMGYAPSHYAGNVHILGGDVARAPRDIKDGAEQTIMAGEAPAGFKAWGNPTNWRDPARGVNRAPDGFGGPYAGGANFTFADGSVKFLKNTTDPMHPPGLGHPGRRARGLLQGITERAINGFAKELSAVAIRKTRAETAVVEGLEQLDSHLWPHFRCQHVTEGDLLHAGLSTAGIVAVPGKRPRDSAGPCVARLRDGGTDGWATPLASSIAGRVGGALPEGPRNPAVQQHGESHASRAENPWPPFSVFSSRWSHSPPAPPEPPPPPPPTPIPADQVATLAALLLHPCATGPPRNNSMKHGSITGRRGA